MTIEQTRNEGGELASAGAAPWQVNPSGTDPYDVFVRIGQLTRKLHDALHQLGYDKDIAGAVSSLPDARTRLDYIARLTGQAAEKVLSLVEDSQRAVQETEARTAALRARLSEGESICSADIVGVLDQLSAASIEQHTRLTEIMLAQDFHDLTGQVIRKIVDVAAHLEEQLVKLLLDTTPPQQREQRVVAGPSGPVVDLAARQDTVTNQAQVDDLLASLGF